MKLFEHFDMDGNGKIDSYEMVCALAMLSHSTLEVSNVRSLYLIGKSRVDI